MAKDSHLVQLVHIFVENCSYVRFRKIFQNVGLLQGSVLEILVFNIYVNDQPIHPNTQSFIYVGDLRVDVLVRDLV